MSSKKPNLETFLRDKLESEIQTFGDGNTEFHTRDLEQLLNIMDDKDEEIYALKEQLAQKQSLPVTEEFIANVALSLRHDFGLMNKDEQSLILAQGLYWIKAINSVLK